MGLCWIWNGSTDRAASYRAFITVDSKTWGLNNYVASVAGLTRDSTQRFMQKCGKDMCCNPDHMEVVPEWMRQQHVGRHRLSMAQVLAIYALKDIEETKKVAAQYGVTPWTIRHIWSGRTHNKLTGAIPNNKKVDK